MKEHDIDNVLRLAVANLHQQELPAVFKEAVENQPRAPLALMIESFLAEHTQIESKALLQAIADLNQGTPEDLDRPDFQSYLIGRFGMSETVFDQARRALATHRRFARAQSGEQMQLAARDEAGTGGCAADVDEIRLLFKKRKK